MTTVVPSGNAEPEASPPVRTIVAPGALSLTVGGVKVTTALVFGKSTETLMSAGRLLMVGAMLSSTVTLAVAVAVLPLLSVTVRVPGRHLMHSPKRD